MVLCLHGFSTDASIYASILPLLAQQGFLVCARLQFRCFPLSCAHLQAQHPSPPSIIQAVALDLYGRGYSDAPDKDCVCDDRFFVSAVAEFLLLVREATQSLSVQPLDLVGYRYNPPKTKPISALNAVLEIRESRILFFFHLPSQSMGGAVAVAFGQRFPNQVQSLFLIAPAGLPAPMPWTARMLSVPGVGDLLFSMAGKASLMKHVEDGKQCNNGSTET